MSAPAPFIIVKTGPERYYIARLESIGETFPYYVTTGYTAKYADSLTASIQALLRGERPR
jgi:hypothetical protein